MSKLHNKFNNPVDVGLSKIYSPWIPTLRNAGVTPNMLTTASMLCGFYSAKLILDNQPKRGALFFALNYLFDCMDGYMARLYKMETHFGDWYDHVTDWITMGLVLYAILKTNKYTQVTMWVISIVTAFLIYNTTRWFGCQEKIYNSEIGRSISGFKQMCENPTVQLYTTRYFGTGTLGLFVYLVIYFSQHR